MTEQELFKFFQLLRRPIYWDPPPPWLRLTKDQLTKFNKVQEQMNNKIAQLEAEKMESLQKIVGISGK